MIICLVASALLMAAEISGHGYLVDPPNRSSMWRFGYHTPVDYDDNELYCGGFGVQWQDNHGKCGECGDAYNLPRPRPNEDGGKYGLGIITRNYTKDQVIDVKVLLTKTHMGFFEFRICPNDNVKKPVEQSCLDKYLLHLADGSGTQFYPTGQSPIQFTIPLQLPKGLTCSQCVVQWHYHTGNSWGTCPNGTEGMGCGPQETFRNCADVAVY